MLQMICWFSTLICRAMSMHSSESLWTIKGRVASLLKKDIKADVLSQSSSKKNKDVNVAGLFCGKKKLKQFWVRRQKSPPFSPKLLFLLGNLAHQVTRSHCTALTVVPAPDPARDHALQTRTEIPDLVALGFSERRNPVMAAVRVQGHVTRSLKSRDLELECFQRVVHLLRCGRKLIN